MQDGGFARLWLWLPGVVGLDCFDCLLSIVSVRFELSILYPGTMVVSVDSMLACDFLSCTRACSWGVVVGSIRQFICLLHVLLGLKRDRFFFQFVSLDFDSIRPVCVFDPNGRCSSLAFFFLVFGRNTVIFFLSSKDGVLAGNRRIGG